MSAPRWYAYVLVSFDEAAPGRVERRVGRTYVGVAIDVERRARQHNGELPGGARSTRVGRPWRVALRYGPFADRASAQALEYALKRRRGAKARLAPLFCYSSPKIGAEPNGVLKRRV